MDIGPEKDLAGELHSTLLHTTKSGPLGFIHTIKDSWAIYKVIGNALQMILHVNQVIQLFFLERFASAMACTVALVLSVYLIHHNLSAVHENLTTMIHSSRKGRPSQGMECIGYIRGTVEGVMFGMLATVTFACNDALTLKQAATSAATLLLTAYSAGNAKTKEQAADVQITLIPGKGHKSLAASTSEAFKKVLGVRYHSLMAFLVLQAVSEFAMFAVAGFHFTVFPYCAINFLTFPLIICDYHAIMGNSWRSIVEIFCLPYTYFFPMYASVFNYFCAQGISNIAIKQNVAARKTLVLSTLRFSALAAALIYMGTEKFVTGDQFDVALARGMQSISDSWQCKCINFTATTETIGTFSEGTVLYRGFLVRTLFIFGPMYLAGLVYLLVKEVKFCKGEIDDTWDMAISYQEIADAFEKRALAEEVKVAPQSTLAFCLESMKAVQQKCCCAKSVSAAERRRSEDSAKWANRANGFRVLEFIVDDNADVLEKAIEQNPEMKDLTSEIFATIEEVAGDMEDHPPANVSMQGNIVKTYNQAVDSLRRVDNDENHPLNGVVIKEGQLDELPTFEEGDLLRFDPPSPPSRYDPPSPPSRYDPPSPPSRD